MTTPSNSHPAALAGGILAAALLLPGVTPALAQTPPEHASISLNYLHYEDRQPGLERVRVAAPSLALVTPLAGAWSLEAALTRDAVSGATPRYHTAVSGASRMSDSRSAGEVALTRYFPRASVTVGGAYSTEHDYDSRALSLSASVSSEDRNTTWSAGIGGSDDSINPVNRIVVGESRQTLNFLLGATRVLTPNDIVQLTLTHNRGHGYYSDPYKVDNRPRERRQNTLLARWNHHIGASDGTSRLSYRYYSDSYRVRAHTLVEEYVQALPQGWSVTPSLRLYSQSAARFYYDPVYDATLGEPFPPGFAFGDGRHFSADQRLSGFGAVTLALKVAKKLGPDWTAELKVSAYEQRGNWRLFQRGSPGLEPLRARSLQLGLTRQW